MNTVRNRGVANFIGTGLDALTYEEMFDLVDSWIADKTGRSHHIACLNAYCVALAHGNARLMKIYNGADIAGADGMPFVRWIRLFDRCSCDRLAAPDTILELAQRSKEKNYSFYLYGGHPEITVRMKDYLETRFPWINIVGYRSPPFTAPTSAEDEATCREINGLQPDIICVGLGTPKQDYWIDDHLYKIKGSVIIASGATFDFFGGRIKMAPEFIRKSGFEWLYRLFSKDFMRLLKRYTLYNSLFVWRFMLQLLRFKRYENQRWERPDSI